MKHTKHTAKAAAALALGAALALLAGCTPASDSVSSPSASASSVPAVSESALASESTAGESAPVSSSYAAAPGPAYAMDELWSRLEAAGKVWMPAQPGEEWSSLNGFAYPVAAFSTRGDGGYQMEMYSAAGSGATSWVFAQSTRDETGAYHLTAEQTDTEGSATVYLDGCGDRLTLVLYEDGTLDLQMERPALHKTFVANERLYPLSGGYWEATALDEKTAARVNEQADEYGQVALSNTEYWQAGGEVLPLRTWRAVTLEEAQGLVN